MAPAVLMGRAVRRSKTLVYVVDRPARALPAAGSSAGVAAVGVGLELDAIATVVIAERG